MRIALDVSSIDGRTFVVFGDTLESRKLYINDLLSQHRETSGGGILLDEIDAREKHLSIEHARQLLERVRYTSLQKGTQFFVIYGADTLSIVVQNALLKTLEEVSKGKSFILELARVDSLLPTIQSRAFHIKVNGESPNEVFNVKDLQSKSLADLFVVAEEYSESVEKSRDLVEGLLSYMRKKYLEKGIVSQHINFTEFLLTSYGQIGNTNVSLRLLLENCMLNFYSLFVK